MQPSLAIMLVLVIAVLALCLLVNHRQESLIRNVKTQEMPMSKRAASVRIIIASTIFAGHGLLLGFLAVLSPVLAVPALLILIVAVCILFRCNWARILARWLGAVVATLFIIHILLLLFFLIAAPQLLFFEGGIGIISLLVLLAVTPCIMWMVKSLNRQGVLIQFGIEANR